jgi:mutator protein MutT
MGYVKEMRRIIGKRPMIMCACGCLIFNKNNEVLLQKRSDDGLWGNPGGSMDIGETCEDTVIREIKEETGLNILKEDLHIFNIYSGETQHHIYPNGDEVYYVNIIYMVSKYNGDITVDDESEQLRFFALSELPKDVTKPFVDVKKDLERIYINGGN